MPHERSVSVRIVETIASYEGVDATVLEPPLQTVIDIDALDEMVQSAEERSTDLTVEFTYNGYAVCIDGASVRVRERQSDEAHDQVVPTA